MILVTLLSHAGGIGRIQFGNSIYRIRTTWLELRSGQYFIDPKHLTFWRKER